MTARIRCNKCEAESYYDGKTKIYCPACFARLEAELRYYKALCKYQEEGMTGWRYVYISDETATELEEARKALEGE